MPSIDDIYRTSLALLTDLYELTMAYGYWKHGMSDRQGVFHLVFRKSPFEGGFTVAAGLEYVLDFIRRFRFVDEDLAYLATVPGSDGRPLFDEAFLHALGELRPRCDIDAVPEATVVFPQEPLVRVSGPLLECQLLESPLLNIVNFQTLIATKAARICHATGGQPVVEFGLRRAQGIDGALSASRAAYLGGCAGTSNVLAGRLFGIPVKGTHAHSWVMSFPDELTAFRAYAETLPNNCVFLVDTYDTLQGVRHAVEVGRMLRAEGHRMVGIRLDSGDLAYLSREARRILDEGGFPEAAIVASNDLDEWIIAELKRQDAKIGLWGVGTKLVTAYDDPALGGVYKLGALCGPDGRWEPRMKLSEQAVKTTIPGKLQVRRFFTPGGEAVSDMIFNELQPEPPGRLMIDPFDITRRRVLGSTLHFEDLLVPAVRGGEVVYQSPPLAEIRRRTAAQLGLFHEGILRHLNPHQYPVGLEKGLFDLKTRLALEIRGLPIE